MLRLLVGRSSASCAAALLSALCFSRLQVATQPLEDQPACASCEEGDVVASMTVHFKFSTCLPDGSRRLNHGSATPNSSTQEALCKALEEAAAEKAALERVEMVWCVCVRGGVCVWGGRGIAE